MYTEDCRSSETDPRYKGHISTTRNGHKCKDWKYASYHRGEEHNYCRTPGGDTDNAGGPWCYISNGWERCNVPVCGGK